MGIGEHFEGVKQHWASNFAFLDYFKKVYGRDQPLPKWSDADVDEFIASAPVYGPQAPSCPTSPSPSPDLDPPPLPLISPSKLPRFVCSSRP
jgi:hypothetical protein